MLMKVVLLICLQVLAYCKNISLSQYKIVKPFNEIELPIFIPALLHLNKIDKIVIKMGHVISKNQHMKFPRGITTYIYNKTVLSTEVLHSISTIFSLSHNTNFQIYLPQEQVTILSDPNDRLCIQQLQHIFNVFFPCQNYISLGLQSLGNMPKLLQHNLALEIELISNDSLTLNLIFENNRKKTEIFIKQSICGTISVRNINEYQFTNGPFALKDKIQYDVVPLNQWYNPQKTICHKIMFRQLNLAASLKLITRLPLGLQFSHIAVYPLKIGFDFSLSRIDTSFFLVINIILPANQTSQYIIHAHLISSLPRFESFESIAGGGEELMHIPLVIHNGSLTQLYSKILTQRYLQPDFSIPFHTITFTVGIIGYLWINLWRVHRFNQDIHQSSQ